MKKQKTLDKEDTITITCKSCGYRLEIETPLRKSIDMTTTCRECYLKKGEK